LFSEAFKALGVEENTSVNVGIAKLPKALGFIHDKLDGKTLGKSQIDTIVEDIVENKISTVELTYFVAGCYTSGLDMKETAYLTEAIVNTGDRLKFDGQKMVLDKHCIGGVPGNRTTMIVTPIIAAAGFFMPKTSSRAITSAAGTADTMEVLAPVNLPKKKLEKVIKKTKACMAWGGAMRLAGADENMVRVRHPLSLDPEGMLLASILAKKKAVGATHVIIDIPYGPSAKVKTKQAAKKLKKKFEKLSRLVGLKVKVVLTDGSQPVGNGIGPALEARDVLSVLHGDGPSDLMERSIFLASELLKMAHVKKPKKVALDILQSGRALEKFKEIVVAQGGNKNFKVPTAKFYHPVYSKVSGTVRSFNNRELAKIARVAGAPADDVAGIYLNAKKGDSIKKGDVLFFIHAKNKDKLENAVSFLRNMSPVSVR